MRNPDDLPRQATDDDLMEIVDRPTGLWINLDGVSDTLRGALVRAAKISAAGRSPSGLRQAETNIVVDHPQMSRLWERLGIVPPQ